MQPTNKIEAEVLKVYNSYWAYYISGQVDEMALLLDPYYNQIGSAESEVFSSKKDAVQFLYDTIHEVEGKLEMRNRDLKLEVKSDTLILINETCDLYALTDNAWVFYSKFRASTLLQETKDGWKISHQHSSFPDIKTDKGKNVAITKIAKENLELKDAVKRRTLELEAKNRTLEVEAALERIRSRSMAMQKSTELAEVSALLDHEVRFLGIETWGCAFNIYGAHDSSEWFSTRAGVIPPYKTPRENIFKKYYDLAQQGHTFHIEEFKGQKCIEHYTYLCTLPEAGEALRAIKKAGGSFPEYQIDHVAYFKQGYLLFITLNPVPEAHEIFKRFAKVFEQTYTRFLDLQKAEAQAREAQIEASLERVRSQAMAMRQSEDLEDCTRIVFDELEKLNLAIERSGIGIFDPVTKNCELWTTVIADNGRKELARGITSLTIHPMLIETFKAWEDQKSYSHILQGKELEDYYNIVTKSKFVLSDEVIEKSSSLPKEYYHYSPFGAGGLYFFSDSKPLDGDKQIIHRFAQVFNLTYKRYEDLQKAEAQAREAQIEAALEKVRSRSLAMHNPEELQEVVAVVAKKLKELGVIFDAGGVIICTYFPDNKDVIHWISVDDFSSSGRYYVPYFDNPIFNDAWDSKMKGDAYFSKAFPVEAKNEFFKNAFANSDYRQMPEDYKQFVLQADSHNLSAAWSKNSAIIIPSLTGKVPSESDAKILTRFAKVFEQAYIRFLDLKKAEEQTLLAEQNLIKLKTQKQRAEEALSELQQTQKQLIQSEKMASLGELTAGIAHEIQNPLNFVNNFSEVNKELLEEMLEEMANGDVEEVKAIANDISQNLEKINHHGKRADGIVKGMLQHSRSSSGTKEPTDINTLADEYLRLAYHGLRAKDKSFNATLETDFDESIGKIDVIPQDMGRVILNLITNAFYAANERKQTTKDEAFKPTVYISTKKLKNTIEISVKDNGNGISKDIVDKIFQPFFTTKPTGQGTGLGLSMSYDIIHAHGGELKVETKDGEGTTFIINLRIND